MTVLYILTTSYIDHVLVFFISECVILCRAVSDVLITRQQSFAERVQSTCSTVVPTVASVKPRVRNTSGDLSRDRIGPQTRVHANSILGGAANGEILTERGAGESQPYRMWAQES